MEEVEVGKKEEEGAGKIEHEEEGREGYWEG